MEGKSVSHQAPYINVFVASNSFDVTHSIDTSEICDNKIGRRNDNIPLVLINLVVRKNVERGTENKSSSRGAASRRLSRLQYVPC